MPKPKPLANVSALTRTLIDPARTQTQTPGQRQIRNAAETKRSASVETAVTRTLHSQPTAPTLSPAPAAGTQHQRRHHQPVSTCTASSRYQQSHRHHHMRSRHPSPRTSTSNLCPPHAQPAHSTTTSTATRHPASALANCLHHRRTASSQHHHQHRHPAPSISTSKLSPPQTHSQLTAPAPAPSTCLHLRSQLIPPSHPPAPSTQHRHQQPHQHRHPAPGTSTGTNNLSPPHAQPAHSTSTNISARHQHRRQQPFSTTRTASSQHPHQHRRPAPASATCLHHVHSQLTAPAPTLAPSTSNLPQKHARATHCFLKQEPHTFAIWGKTVAASHWAYHDRGLQTSGSGPDPAPAVDTSPTPSPTNRLVETPRRHTRDGDHDLPIPQLILRMMEDITAPAIGSKALCTKTRPRSNGVAPVWRVGAELTGSAWVFRFRKTIFQLYDVLERLVIIPALPISHGS